MSEKTFKFDNVEVNKREFPACKQPIALEIVNLNQILISDKFKHSDTGFTYFTGYKDDNLLRPLCIVLAQMNGYIKYFDNGGTNMFFLIEDDSALVKCNKIWNKIKETKGIKFHSNPVYDEKYMKATVKEFNGVVTTIFWGHNVVNESVHYTCIACINIDSVTKILSLGLFRRM